MFCSKKMKSVLHCDNERRKYFHYFIATKNYHSLYCNGKKYITILKYLYSYKHDIYIYIK